MEINIVFYPVYVHIGDGNHAHGVTFPDFPGCFSAADAWSELPAKMQEAVELYFEGEDLPVPVPTPLEKLAGDPDYQGGIWLLADIDMSRIGGKVKRVNVTIPKNILARIDTVAKEEGDSRSGLIARMAMRYISEREARAGPSRSLPRHE